MNWPIAIDPALWVREVRWVSNRRLASRISARAAWGLDPALTARQVGKTTTAAWAMAHFMIYQPGSVVGDRLSGAAAKRRSGAPGEGRSDRRLGRKLKVDNVYGIELENGARVLALPGSDDSIRGLTVDGWIVADEAARLSDDLIAALRPMRARRPQARFAMLSTAWSRTDPFWTAWASDRSVLDPAAGHRRC